MSPQPTATPTESTVTERQIQRANHLERERAKLQEAVDKNRQYLRLMGDNDELSDAEKAWLDSFYPEKEKGERRSDEDIVATRDIREAARKGANTVTEANEHAAKAAKARADAKAKADAKAS